MGAFNHASVDEKPAKLFQPDELAAYEHGATQERETPIEPERRLSFAVLEDAISCFQKYVDAKGGKEKKLYDDAKSWIFDQNGDWPFSFENVCHMCRVDPNYVRSGLVKWRAQMGLVESVYTNPPQEVRKTTRQRGMAGRYRGIKGKRARGACRLKSQPKRELSL